MITPEKFKRVLKIFNKKVCIFCSHKFPEGLLKKLDPLPSSFLGIFNPDFLFHVKITHGFDPETFEIIIDKGLDK